MNTTHLKQIYFAGGCFWGTEHFFKLINGVTDTETGYANSLIPDPTYKEVCTGNTNAAETVRVVYNPEIITLRELIQLYFTTIDPTSVNRQGNDRGTQYRTGIYYTDSSDITTIKESLAALSAHYSEPIAVECAKLINFYPAEQYHQDYLDNNPGGYCHISPKMFELARNYRPGYNTPTQKTLKEKLTPLQYEVTQHGATEYPGTGEYTDLFEPGIYVDITNGQPLFLSTDKFHSQCGWPAFSRPIEEWNVTEHNDTTHGMIRTEIRGATSGAHLGHVFPDGPTQSGGMRYCINSAALRFIPLSRMQQEGYGQYIDLLKQRQQ